MIQTHTEKREDGSIALIVQQIGEGEVPHDTIREKVKDANADIVQLHVFREVELSDIEVPTEFLAKPRFEVSEDGVIFDVATGLEWFVGPDEPINHYDAERYAKNLTIAGGGWRLPSRQELTTIYQKGKGDRNMDPVFKTTGWWVWSQDINLSDYSFAWGFNFRHGGEYWGGRYGDYDRRAFAVRSRSR